MKKVGKIISIFYLCIFGLMIICVIVIVYGICNTNTTIFNNKYYISIEELHEDYILELDKAYNAGASMTDYYPKEIVNYFEENDDVFVVCTYSSLIHGKIKEDALFIYIVKKNNEGYYLEIPHFGVSAIHSISVPLYNSYTSCEYTQSYIEYKNNNYQSCYGFAFKRIDNDNDFYFDGVRMNKFRIINPFTEKEVELCYAVSDKVYNFIEMIFVSKNKRHTLIIK